MSVLLMALVLLASLPTGTDTAGRAVPEGARLAASIAAEDVEVQVISSQGMLSVQVAYPSAKGWLAAALASTPSDAVAAWTGTRGRGPIPALSVVYGRVPGSYVVIEWADGTRTRAPAERDGTFLAVRDRYVDATLLHVLDAAGTIVLEIDDL
ncbi:MAG: hypothetical protein WD691_07425 [Acidimicrobiales bacterium]